MMGWLPWKKKKDQESIEDVPEAWAEELIDKQPVKQGLVKLKVVGPPMIKLPNSRGFKRKTAWVLTLFNLFAALSASWGLGIDGVPFFIFFVLNTVMMREYLYETSIKEKFIVQDEKK